MNSLFERELSEFIWRSAENKCGGPPLLRVTEGLFSSIRKKLHDKYDSKIGIHQFTCKHRAEWSISG